MRRRHALTVRHRAAVLALLADSALTDEQLRAAIGAYATNVIKSLFERRLILSDKGVPQLTEGGLVIMGRWKLTKTGRELAAQLATASLTTTA